MPAPPDRPGLPPLDPPRKKARRGFAAMSPEKRRQIAAMGGAAVPPDKRSFSQDRALAVEAGTKGGKMVQALGKGHRWDSPFARKSDPELHKADNARKARLAAVDTAEPHQSSVLCGHEGWSFEQYGRRCPVCGEFVEDMGD